MTTTRQARNSRFQRGSAVYTCDSCGKRTRETGNSESYCGMCAKCYDDGGIENGHTDNGHPYRLLDCPLCAGYHSQHDSQTAKDMQKSGAEYAWCDNVTLILELERAHADALEINSGETHDTLEGLVHSVNYLRDEMAHSVWQAGFAKDKTEIERQQIRIGELMENIFRMIPDVPTDDDPKPPVAELDHGTLTGLPLDIVGVNALETSRVVAAQEAPAVAGFVGNTNVHAAPIRTGDEWGQDAKMGPEQDGTPQPSMKRDDRLASDLAGDLASERQASVEDEQIDDLQSDLDRTNHPEDWREGGVI